MKCKKKRFEDFKEECAFHTHDYLNEDKK